MEDVLYKKHNIDDERDRKLTLKEAIE